MSVLSISGKARGSRKLLDAIDTGINRYFSNTLKQHGASPKGADWRDGDAQKLRFRQLCQIFNREDRPPESAAGQDLVRIVDYGCGYGALLQYLEKNDTAVDYLGLDLTPDMVRAARELHKGKQNCRFEEASLLVDDTDYTLCSGTFNIMPEGLEDGWQSYVVSCLDNINAFSKKGFAFNLLTSYNDADKVKPHLFYGDPLFFLDLCLARYSRNVALLHDYGAFEFTILVKKGR